MKRFQDHIKTILKKCDVLFDRRRLFHQSELPGDLPLPMECYIVMRNTIVLQLSYAILDTSMTKRSAHFQSPLSSVNFVADNATDALAYTATMKLTLNDEEEYLVIRNGWTPGDEEDTSIVSKLGNIAFIQWKVCARIPFKCFLDM